MTTTHLKSLKYIWAGVRHVWKKNAAHNSENLFHKFKLEYKSVVKCKELTTTQTLINFIERVYV